MIYYSLLFFNYLLSSAKVEFSSDNGANWALCDLKPKLDAFAWAPWSITWEATLG